MTHRRMRPASARRASSPSWAAAAPAFADADRLRPPVQRVVVTGIRESLQQAIAIKRNSDDQVDAISAHRHRQAARQERRRRSAAHPGRQHRVGGQRRRRLRRERPGQHPRHLAQPDPGHRRRPRDRHRRLVHPRPVSSRWPQRQLHPAAGGNGPDRPWSTRPRTPRCSRAASPAWSISTRATPLSLGKAIHLRGLGRGRLQQPDRQQWQAAVQRPDRLEERRRHLRRSGAGLLRRPQRRALRPGDPGLHHDHRRACRSARPIRQPDRGRRRRP